VLIGDDAEKAIKLVTEAAYSSGVLNLVIDGTSDDTDLSSAIANHSISSVILLTISTLYVCV